MRGTTAIKILRKFPLGEKKRRVWPSPNFVIGGEKK